jgi:nucleotide-binding universal stress UspA family protein
MPQALTIDRPAKEIVEFATNLRADRVIAGNQGRSSTSELFLRLCI